MHAVNSHQLIFSTVKWSSLAPRPEKGRRKGPGFHCLRMRLIAVDFHRHRGRSIHVRALVSHSGYQTLRGPYSYSSKRIWRAFLQTLIVLPPMPSSA